MIGARGSARGPRQVQGDRVGGFSVGWVCRLCPRVCGQVGADGGRYPMSHSDRNRVGYGATGLRDSLLEQITVEWRAARHANMPRMLGET